MKARIKKVVTIVVVSSIATSAILGVAYVNRIQPVNSTAWEFNSIDITTIDHMSYYLVKTKSHPQGFLFQGWELMELNERNKGGLP